MIAHVKPRPLVALLVLFLTAASAPAQPDPVAPTDGGSVAQRQALQERVRAMARDLVGGVIDIQLQQLRENDLQSLAIYGELTEMRKHVDELVARQMPGVLEVLTRLAESPADQREPLLVAARQKSRQVLVSLLVERQTVLRRLRIAEIAAQVRRVIAMQTNVLGVTEKLPAEPAARREPGTLRAIEDQADVAAVYRGLKQMLRDAAGWVGPVGAEATEGLRLLETAHVDAELANAESRLRAAQLAEAPASQQAVIRGLEPLLVRMERAQGLDQPDTTSAEQALNDLVKEQQQLRQETAETNLAQPEADKLVNRQAELAKRVKPLAEAPNAPAEMKQDLQQATAAAKEAAAKMFEQKRDDALAEQQRAIESLKRAAQRAAELPAAQAKAEQIEAAKLDRTREALKDILQQQQKATADAAEKPAEAKRQEEQVSARLAETPKQHAMPEEVARRVDEAKKAVDEAARRMDQPRAERHQAARQAEQAIERAVAQAEAAANQARLRELAEKAKPAEKADAKAQAEQRRAAEELKRLMAEMRKTLDDARQAVEQEIGNRMDSAAKRAERLAEAQQRVAQAVAEQQQAAGRPQAAEAAKMARQVEKAAQTQADAASAPERHADLAQSLKKLAAEAKPAPLADALREAEKATRQAAEQMAKGREAQAERAAAKEALAKAQQLAQAHAAETRKAPPGKPDAQAQQRVTQAAAEAQRLAQADAPQAAATLNKAQAESAEAARNASEGRPEPTTKSQQATAEMLDHAAQELAEAQRRLVQQSPPEFAHQSQNAQQLAHKAMPADPEATQALQRAENQAREAANPPAPSPAQMADADRRVGQALEEAAASLAARERQLGQAAQARPKPSMLARQKAKTDRTTDQPPTEQSETGRRMEDDALGAGSGADAARPAVRALTNDPWLAKLPPEVRSAIRANSQRTPPRGYEDRMQKYFRNIE
jgi:hypothetical protein